MHDRLEHPWVDNSRAEFIRARFPDNPSIADVTEFCAAIERFLERSDTRFGWVTDLSQLHTAGAVQRKLFVDANRRSEARLAQRAVAIAVYAPRPFQRGLVTLFSWFMPSAFPLRVFADLPEAEAWVEECLQAAQKTR